MAKRSIEPRFYLFLVLFLATIVSVIYVFLRPSHDAIITYGSLEFREKFEGVVVRDEETIEIDEYGSVDYVVSEGINVVRGELVASVYTLNYNEKSIQSLIDIRQEINDYQENTLLEDIVNVELSSINEDIEQKTLEIRDVIQGEGGNDLLTLERELSELMEQKEIYLESAVKADETLNSLYSQRDELNQQIESWAEDLYAEGSGLISFYFDGFENYLNLKNIDTYTVNDIQNVIDGTDVSALLDDDVTYPVYKLVNSVRWYIIVTSDRSIPEFNKNTYFTMIFDQNTEKQHTGELLGKRIYNNGYVYTFEFRDEIDQLLDARVVSIEMYNVFEGLMVPQEAVLDSDGVKYLSVIFDGETENESVPVVVAAVQDGKAIVASVEGYPAISEGDTVIY